MGVATKNIDNETLGKVMGIKKRSIPKRTSFDDEYNQFKAEISKKILKKSPLAKINFKKVKSSFIKQQGFIERFGRSDEFTKTDAERLKLKEYKKKYNQKQLLKN